MLLLKIEKCKVYIFRYDNNYNNNNNNKIFVYLRANLTAQRPITKSARARGRTQKELTNKIQNKAVCIIAIH
jgi:hypothetical protein